MSTQLQRQLEEQKENALRIAEFCDDQIKKLGKPKSKKEDPKIIAARRSADAYMAKKLR